MGLRWSVCDGGPWTVPGACLLCVQLNLLDLLKSDRKWDTTCPAPQHCRRWGALAEWAAPARASLEYLTWWPWQPFPGRPGLRNTSGLVTVVTMAAVPRPAWGQEHLWAGHWGLAGLVWCPGPNWSQLFLTLGKREENEVLGSATLDLLLLAHA